jgi:hypothetical protein
MGSPARCPSSRTIATNSGALRSSTSWASCIDSTSLSAFHANVESGFYPLPEDHDGSPFTLIDRSRLFFEDLLKIHRRRERRAYNEVLDQKTRGKRLRYYLQNFHFQSGGWMTDDSAQRL